MPESLKRKLAAARRRWRFMQTVGGLAAAFAVLAFLILFAFYSDRLLVLGTGGRAVSLIALLAAGAVAAIVFLVRPLRRPIPDEAVALEVERRFPVLEERLLTTIELAHAGAGHASGGVSGAMIAQLAGEAERMAAPLDFLQAIPTAPVHRTTAWAALAALLLLGHIVLAPEAMGVWIHRILHPSADIPLYARTLVWALPGDRVVVRGQDVQVGVKTGGRLPDHARLHYRFDGGAWTQVELSKPRTVAAHEGAFRTFPFKINGVQQGFSYFATAGDGRSNPHAVRVEDRPTILSVRLRLNYPAYTGRRPQTIVATAGNIVAPAGTRVEVTATANKPLWEAMLMEDGKARGRWEVRGETARGRLTVLRDQTYGLRLRDTSGFGALNPPEYTLRALADRTPVVHIVRPGTEVERTPGGSVTLGVTADDDYGVRQLRLAYHTGRRSASLPLPGADGRRQVTTGAVWNLASLLLKPGDTVAYEALARDGDTVSGPHTGRSATYRIRILSVKEMRERLQGRVTEEQEALRQLTQHQKAAQNQLSQAGPDPSRAGALSSAETAQQGVAQEAGDLARRMRQTTEQMRDNGLAAPSELGRREGAQRSLRKLASKDMPAAADRIRRAGQQAARRRSLLADAAGQEQAIREELERLWHELGPALDTAQLAQLAGQIAREQQRLADQARIAAEQMGSRTPAQMSAQERAQLNAQARRQSDLHARTGALQQSVQQASRDARERGQADAASLQSAAEQLRQAGVPQQQASARRSLQSGQPAEASLQQDQAARDLQSLASRLGRAGRMPPDAEALQQLEQMTDRLKQMARQQDAIQRQVQKAADRGETGDPPPRSDLQELTHEEQSLRAATRQISPRLQDAPQAQQAINDAGRDLQQAARQLDQAAPAAASDPATQAQRQLQQAALAAQEAVDALRQAAATREVRKAVEQLAHDQHALRRRTRQLQNAHGGALTPPQQKRAQALALDQSTLLKRGRDLVQQMPSQAFAWAQSEASQRMEEAANGLRHQNAGEDTQRQQEHAAQTLERIGRALGQQAQADAQQAAGQAGQQAGQQATGTARMASAAAQLQLAREMQAQIRQETASLDSRRSRNAARGLTAAQQRELTGLDEAQRHAQYAAQDAGQQLRVVPQAAETLQRAQEEMQDAQGMLSRQQTGAPTQGRQQNAVNMLDQALNRTEQAMSQQRRAQEPQPGPGRTADSPNPGGEPRGRSPHGGSPPGGLTPLGSLKDGALPRTTPHGRGFAGLGPRGQKELREGREEHVPAEYRDLVNQYYKALSQGVR